MTAVDVLEKVRENLTGTVIGEPITADGLTVIPVTRIGGGGGGGGLPKRADAETGGAGFGVRAHPVGVFVVKDGSVVWRPSVDVNRVILGMQVVAVVALLVLRSIARRRRRPSAGPRGGGHKGKP